MATVSRSISPPRAIPSLSKLFEKVFARTTLALSFGTAALATLEFFSDSVNAAMLRGSALVIAGTMLGVAFTTRDRVLRVHDELLEDGRVARMDHDIAFIRAVNDRILVADHGSIDEFYRALRTALNATAP